MGLKIRKQLTLKSQAVWTISLIAVCFLFSIVIYSFFLGSLQRTQHPQYPKAEQGVLDLRGWDFEKYGPVPLEGSWEFYWEQLLKPLEVPGVEAGLIQVPSTWNSKKSLIQELPGSGYATYRLTLLLDEQVDAGFPAAESPH